MPSIEADADELTQAFTVARYSARGVDPNRVADLHRRWRRARSILLRTGRL